MTKVSEILADARNQFMTSQHDRYNTLGADLSATATTATFTFDTGGQQVTAIVAGTEIEIDLEAMLVVAGGAGATTATVLRGYRGSAKKAHTSGTLVRVRPVLRDQDLFVALNHELRSLSSPLNGVYRVDRYEFTPTGNIGFDLPLPLRFVTTVLDVFAVRYKQPQGYWMAAEEWKFDRMANTTDFPSGLSLTFPGGAVPGWLHRVWYRAGFSTVEALTDDVEAVAGIHSEAIDILAMGCAIRTADTREIARNLHERAGDARRASEVPPGASLNAPAALRKLYDTRKAEERARLLRVWGGNLT
jgi:hypothetical protein